MKRIVVTNSKGGTGKSTIAANLASFYALAGYKTTIIDYDPQASSSHWVDKRPINAVEIQSIRAYQAATARVTKSWFLKPQPGTQRIIIDTPSGLDAAEFKTTLAEADAILIPVTPSSIDIHASTHFIADLLLGAKLKREHDQIAVIANRSRKNTVAYRKLEHFLLSLHIPFVSSLRDTQNYIKTIEQGSSIFEAGAKQMQQDISDWSAVFNWLEQCFDSSDRRSGSAIQTAG